MSLQEATTDVEIYTQDIAWLQKSDVVIAECSNSSLAVGYNLAHAEKYEKPVHIFYNTYRGSLSAAATGDSHCLHTKNIVQITIIFANIAFILSINFAEKLCKNHSYVESTTISPGINLNTVQKASLSPEALYDECHRDFRSSRNRINHPAENLPPERFPLFLL
ncbi:MAG: hypothetical protein IJ719_06610 [Clostridia bacterium]|nr:hypothetical protein [Clostridia bacterium]